MIDDELSLPLDRDLGPAPAIPQERADAMVSRALEELEDHASRSPSHMRRVAAPKRSRATVFLLLAAAVLIAGAAAAAAYRLTTRPARSAGPSVPVTLTVAASPTNPTTTPSPEALETTASPATSEAPPAQPAVTALAPSDLPPADLLAVANDQRAHKRWQGAAQTYESIVSRSPRSEEAYTAMVAAASLELEQLGAPNAALALYRKALATRPNGSLSEEARWGVAESYRALGDSPAEANALREFLAAHPDSALSAKAHARLSNL